MYFIRSGKVELLQPKVTQKNEKKCSLLQMVDAHKSKRHSLLGEPDNSHYGIFGRRGFTHAEIRKELEDNHAVANTLGQGDQFGELGMSQQGHGGRRLATAVVVEDTEMLSLHADDLSVMLKHAQVPNDVVQAVAMLMLSWVQAADRGERPLTPDLKVLSSIVSSDSSTITKPLDTFQRAVRVTMLATWWRKMAEREEQDLTETITVPNKLMQDMALVAQQLQARDKADMELKLAKVKASVGNQGGKADPTKQKRRSYDKPKAILRQAKGDPTTSLHKPSPLRKRRSRSQRNSTSAFHSGAAAFKGSSVARRKLSRLKPSTEASRSPSALAALGTLAEQPRLEPLTAKTGSTCKRERNFSLDDNGTTQEEMRSLDSGRLTQSCPMRTRRLDFGRLDHVSNE